MSYAIWPSQIPAQNIYDSSSFISPDYNDDQISTLYSSYSVAQPGLIDNSGYFPMSTDDLSYLIQHNQLNQAACSAKSTDAFGYMDSGFVSGYPATSFDLNNYGYPDSISVPVDMNQFSQQSTCFDYPYADVYPSQWSVEDPAQYSNMPELMSSANSVASLSPFSDTVSWQSSSIGSTPFPVEEEEEQPLQGLGLYDCPDLTMDEYLMEEFQPNPKRLSLGKGLKLEESFQFDESSIEEDNDEEEYEDDE